MPSDAPLKLMVIMSSTRPGRVGLPVAKWFYETALENGSFEVDFCDLLDVNLPMVDEPNHPRLKQYVHQHTRDWSARVDAADAFVIVTPEYNHGMTSALKNAIDYLHSEWHYKACGFVSYGGGSGGMRAVEGCKPVMTCLRVMPVFETVGIAGFANMIKDGVFEAPDAAKKAAVAMLDELKRWAGPLRMLRENEAAQA